MEEGGLMARRTERIFTPYSAAQMVKDIEEVRGKIGAWDAKVPIGAPIYVALTAYSNALMLLLHTARGDVYRPIGRPDHTTPDHSSPPGMTPRDWP